MNLVRLLMPYFWLAAAYPLLPLSITSKQVLSPIVVTLWVGIIIGLVIIRQVLVIHENQRINQQIHNLNIDLEKRIAERTSALTLANQELHQREMRLAHTALHDPLTDLPNRALLTDRLKQAIRRMHRDPSYSFGVLFMDLDSFKIINDSLGHESGDQLLMKVANSLSACVCDTDTVARLGGDEFVILLDGTTGDYMKDVANRVLNILSTPVEFGEHKALLATSMGIVLGSPDYESPTDILRDADLAMYEAKALGKARYVLFTPELRATALDQLELEKDLRLALDHQQLILYYQPIMNLKHGKLVAGFEALLRWQHPNRGQILQGVYGRFRYRLLIAQLSAPVFHRCP